MTEKKYQIFISSTYEDLKEERMKIIMAILKANHIPTGMEGFSGASETIDLIKKWIDECDIYMLLISGRYGDIYEKNISYTEWEYRYASERNQFV